MDQGRCFLFATVHPADRDVLTTDIHAPVLACLTEDVRHWLADAPAHMMGQLPLDLDGLRRGVHQPVRRLIEHRPAAEAACSQYAVCKVTIFNCPAVDGAPVRQITRGADTAQRLAQCQTFADLVDDLCPAQGRA